MATNIINSYGIDSFALPNSPLISSIIYPKSTANSAQMPAQIVAQSVQPTWVLNNSQAVGVPEYILEDQLQWALTFPPASAGTQTAIYKGTPAVVFDCARCVQLTFNIATENLVTITINGFDEYGTSMVESSNLSSGITSYTGFKAFSIVTSIYFSTYPWLSSGQTVLVRGGNNIGLPYFVNTTQTVALVYWNGVLQSSVFTAGNPWRLTTPSSTTPDARGTINLTAASPLPNGTTQLQVNFYAYGLDSIVNAQLEKVLSQPSGTVTYEYDRNKNTIGSSIQIAGIQNSSVTGTPKLTRLVNQDRFGAQFPGDLDFMTYYGTL